MSAPRHFDELISLSSAYSTGVLIWDFQTQSKGNFLNFLFFQFGLTRRSFWFWVEDLNAIVGYSLRKYFSHACRFSLDTKSVGDHLLSISHLSDSNWLVPYRFCSTTEQASCFYQMSEWAVRLEDIGCQAGHAHPELRLQCRTIQWSWKKSVFF